MFTNACWMWSKKNLSEMTKKAQVVSMYFDPLKSHYKVEWSQDQRKFLSKSVPLKKRIWQPSNESALLKHVWNDNEWNKIRSICDVVRDTMVFACWYNTIGTNVLYNLEEIFLFKQKPLIIRLRIQWKTFYQNRMQRF